MRFLFLGDIVGKPGMDAVTRHVARIRTEWSLDAVVVNAENASDGSGLLPQQHDQLIEAGVDGITLGDHIYKRKEIFSTLQRSDRIVKPANYPASAVGKTRMTLKTIRGTLAVISVMGRVYMRPVDCPFEAVDRELKAIGNSVDAILVDIHGEATSDKQAMARHLDGRVTAVLGTHTHVPTADGRVLPGGTALQCDVGMCGPYESIIGRDYARVLQTTRSFEPHHFHVATGDVRLCGAIIESDKAGLAKSIERFEISADWDGR
jgi:2',3'-cyclic-nucleotide 2'-phosphodiesterase